MLILQYIYGLIIAGKVLFKKKKSLLEKSLEKLVLVYFVNFIYMQLIFNLLIHLHVSLMNNPTFWSFKSNLTYILSREYLLEKRVSASLWGSAECKCKCNSWKDVKKKTRSNRFPFSFCGWVSKEQYCLVQNKTCPAFEKKETPKIIFKIINWFQKTKASTSKPRLTNPHKVILKKLR